MNKIEAIRSEIERKLDEALFRYHPYASPSVVNAYKNLLSFIDSLPQEPDNEEPNRPKLSDNLEEAAKQFVGYDMDTDDLRDYEVGIQAFIAGAEWRKKQMGEQARVV